MTDAEKRKKKKKNVAVLVAASLLLLRAVTFTLCTAQVETERHFILFRTQTGDKLADRSGRETDRNVSNKLGREHVFVFQKKTIQTAVL